MWSLPQVHSLIPYHLLQQIEFLVIIYLVTDIIHLIFCSPFIINYALSCSFCTLESIPVFFTLGKWLFCLTNSIQLTNQLFSSAFSLYFWIVAFFYWRRLLWEHNPENDDWGEGVSLILDLECLFCALVLVFALCTLFSVLALISH